MASIGSYLLFICSGGQDILNSRFNLLELRDPCFCCLHTRFITVSHQVSMKYQDVTSCHIMLLDCWGVYRYCRCVEFFWCFLHSSGLRTCGDVPFFPQEAHLGMEEGKSSHGPGKHGGIERHWQYCRHSTGPGPRCHFVFPQTVWSSKDVEHCNWPEHWWSICSKMTTCSLDTDP